jgi:iron-sulfur cluster repair protein YtfE (RIC family)
MEADSFETKTKMTPCGSPLPELEVPMINTMVTCLGIEHKKLNTLVMRLANFATRLSGDRGSATAYVLALQVWEEIRHDLRSHLQIEDELVLSWSESHHAIPGALLDTLKNERQEMHKLMATLRELPADVDHEKTAEDRNAFAETLLALARTLDSHVERYDGEVLPSILRAVFRK